MDKKQNKNKCQWLASFLHNVIENRLEHFLIKNCHIDGIQIFISVWVDTLTHRNFHHTFVLVWTGLNWNRRSTHCVPFLSCFVQIKLVPFCVFSVSIVLKMTSEDYITVILLQCLSCCLADCFVHCNEPFSLDYALN